MRKLYQEILERINDIDFGRLWPNFHQYEFVLYTSKSVWLREEEIEWDERFIGNTSIELNGQYIAIWNIEQDFLESDDKDLYYLTSYIVHEMFHAFQLSNGEVRFPKDLTTLKYPSDTTNFQLKFEENKILKAAFETEDGDHKRVLLNQFCGIRQKRKQLIGDMVQCEYLTETVEGMAVYVQCLALKQLSEEKYAEQCNKYGTILTTLDRMQLDIRRISYYTGAILLLTAHDAEINIYHDFMKTTDTIFEIIVNKLIPILPSLVFNERMNDLVVQVRESKKDSINKFKKNLTTSNVGNFIITGYDPMNMIRLEDYILCSSFVRLTDIRSNRTETLFGETLLVMEEGSIDRVQSYSKLHD